MKKRVRTLSIAWLVVFGLVFLLVGTAPAQVFQNPYQSIDWQAVGYYDANLHTHTRLSDGHLLPHDVIDEYHKLGYSILALTDHDTLHRAVFPKALYPWTALSEVYELIKDQESRRWEQTWAEASAAPWENRDPDELGMVAVQGSEISRPHHIGSYFNEYAGGARTEEEAFFEIGKRGGLAVFFHPGRYDRDTDWYVGHYRSHPHLVGMEVYNQRDRYPDDRELWDRVLHRLMPERPVWGFANDDMHGIGALGRNRNVMLLRELNTAAVRAAMEKGHFYFFVPVERGVPPDIKITHVRAEDHTIRLDIEGEYSVIEWVTHDAEKTGSRAVTGGTSVSMEEMPVDAVFVRAVIISEAGRTYTQPFGIVRE